MFINKIAKTLFYAAMFFSVCSCSDQETPDVEPLRQVRTLVISDKSAINAKTFSGVSRSAQESRLSFKVAGTIIEIPVKVGERINAGKVIAKIDPTIYELQLQQTQAEVAKAKASARNASVSYDRIKSLYANTNASLGDLDAARASSESAQAQLRLANKSLQLAELNLAYTELKVDVNCTLDSVSVEINENVGLGNEVARVNCSDDIEIEVQVPESVINSFYEGLVTEISFDVIPDNLFKGVVAEVGGNQGSQGATFTVIVLVQKKHHLIRPGLAAEVSFLLDDFSLNEYIVPLSAVVRGPRYTFLYVAQPTEKEGIAVVVKRQVELGELHSEGVEITDGINKGDLVIVAGAKIMREGLTVSY